MKYAQDIPVKIIILGCGGTGGYIIPHLYRIGYAWQKLPAGDRATKIIVCDGDIVEEKNLFRQNFIEQDIGKNKAKVLCERYASAFGMEVSYIPNFIESVSELERLCEPDLIKRGYYPCDNVYGKAILIGAVDNNRSRQICNELFKKASDLVYIDSGNGESTGQVVCGVKVKGRTTYKPVCSAYPEMLKDEDKFPSELSCAERTLSAPQSVTANLMAATAVVSFLYNLLITGELKTRAITFSSKLINMRADTVKPRKRKSKAS